jgi:hypothetical protein
MDVIDLVEGLATRRQPITSDRPEMVVPVGETAVVDSVSRERETDDDLFSFSLSEFLDALTGSDLGENVRVVCGATGVDPTLEDADVFPEVTLTDRVTQSSIVDTGTELLGSRSTGAQIGANAALE